MAATLLARILTAESECCEPARDILANIPKRLSPFEMTEGKGFTNRSSFDSALKFIHDCEQVGVRTIEYSAAELATLPHEEAELCVTKWLHIRNDTSTVGCSADRSSINIAIVIIENAPHLFLLIPDIEFSKRRIESMHGYILIYYNVSFTSDGTIDYKVEETRKVTDMPSFGDMLFSFVLLMNITECDNVSLVNSLLETYLEYFCENSGTLTSNACVDFVNEICQKRLPFGYSMVLAIIANICTVDTAMVYAAITNDLRAIFQQSIRDDPACQSLYVLKKLEIEKQRLSESLTFVPFANMEPLFDSSQEEQYIQSIFVEPIVSKMENVEHRINNFKRIARHYLGAADSA